MKKIIDAIVRPLFNSLESGDSSYVYKPSHRLILKIMGSLFLLLACASLAAGIIAGIFGALVPCFVFASIGLVCLVVAFMGSDKAVARIWKNR